MFENYMNNIIGQHNKCFKISFFKKFEKLQLKKEMFDYPNSSIQGCGLVVNEVVECHEILSLNLRGDKNTR